VIVRAGRASASRGIDFAVEDSGTGISAEVLPQLFEPFFTTKIDGTGLGLANARKIIDEHGGAIRVENRVEGGTRFVVHLPAERLTAAED